MFWVNEINDYSETYYPIFLEIRRHFWQTFQLSTWRDGILGGMPLFGDPFAMLLNPINWLVLFVGPVWFFPLAVFISFNIGFFGMLKLIKQVNDENQGSIVFSLVYTLLPLSMAHLKAGHLNIYQAVSFYPWIVYFFLIFLKSKNRKYLVLAAIFSVLVLFSHPGMFYIFNLFFIPFGLFLLRKEQIKNGAVCQSLFKYVLIILSLGAVYFLPAIELSKYITRTIISQADIVPVWTIRSIVGGLFFPYPKITTLDQEAVLYPGIVILVLAILGILRSSRLIRNTALIIIFICLLLSLGNITPIYKFILFILPYSGVLRVSSRFWYVGLFLLILLAYKGTVTIGNKKWIRLIGIFALIELVIFAGLRLGLPGRYGKAVDLSFYQNYFANFADDFRVYATTHALSQKKMAEVNAALADGEYPLQIGSYVNYLKTAAGYHFNKYSVIYPPYHVYEDKPQPDSKLLGRLNVLYIVSPYQLSDDGFRKIDEEDNLFLYKNLNFKKRLWSDSEDFKLLSYHKDGNTIYAVFEAKKKSSINWSINYYPGWQVKVDGEPVAFTKKNSWIQFEFEGLAGRHEFEAKFNNKYYLLGKNISIISTVVIILYLILPGKRQSTPASLPQSNIEIEHKVQRGKK